MRTIVVIMLMVLAINSSGQERSVHLKTTPLGNNLFYSNLLLPSSLNLPEPSYKAILPERRSNQVWLNQSIHHLTFWKINQKFLGMELCEPLDFEWETWGDNKYSDLNLQVKRLEYQRFISNSY